MVPQEQKMLQRNTPRIKYHQVYWNTKIIRSRNLDARGERRDGKTEVEVPVAARSCHRYVHSKYKYASLVLKLDSNDHAIDINVHTLFVNIYTLGVHFFL